MNRTIWPLALGAILVVVAGGCAPTPDTMSISMTAGEEVAGFWKGLWHGFIMFFTFVGSLFSDNVTIYETTNSGKLYNLGYLLGAMIFFGGSSGGGICGSKKK